MPLYTRTGDDGTTGLSSGGRIDKDSVRMHAIGDVDELNAVLGTIGDENLRPLQELLFELGAELAGSEHRVTEQDIKDIEEWIDTVESTNEKLTSFVLPGGCELGARLHLARTVCRRAERNTITLHKSGECSITPVVVLNRMSDLLFALARSINKMAGIGDIPWQPRTQEE